jgi:sugar phosphate isomerase/epimerase
MEKVENYLKLNNKYLREGDALLEKGDYVQASEKFWGAAAEVIKAIAANRGVDIRSHGEIYRFVTALSKELNDTELLRCFSLAGALHQNFYENWLTAEMVVDHSKAVKSLVERLKRLAR